MALKQKDKVVNEGNLAEGVLGAAIVAKLILRKPNGQIGKVTSSDVMKALKVMQKAPLTPKGSTKSQVKMDMGGTAKDKIVFLLNLGKRMMADLRALDLKLLARVGDAAASYVNSPRIEALAEAMYQNNIDNKLEIDVDGISNNTGTKADITVKTDKYIFEKISLKAGAKKSGKTLGQVGGNSWSSVLRLFNEGYNERTKSKDVGLMLPLATKTNEDRYMKLITESPTHGTVAKAVGWAYQTAEKLFNSSPAGKLSQSVYKFLQTHSTKGDSDIKIVMLHLGQHRTLDPLKLEDALKKVKMRAVVRTDTQWPVFIVFDAFYNLNVKAETGISMPSSIPLVPTTVYHPAVLFAIRPKKIGPEDAGYVAHLVEGGPRFDSLLEEKNERIQTV